MPLGYCARCDRLVSIEPREHVGEGRARAWYPVPHHMVQHDQCGGAIVDGECGRCGASHSTEGTIVPLCPGTKRAL